MLRLQYSPIALELAHIEALSELPLNCPALKHGEDAVIVCRSSLPDHHHCSLRGQSMRYMNACGFSTASQLLRNECEDIWMKCKCACG